MLIELRRLYDKISHQHNLFGRGGGGNDDGPKDPEGKEGGEGKDPFENFDFDRFRSSRPKEPGDTSKTPENKSDPGKSASSSGSTGKTPSSGNDDDTDADDEPPRTTRPRTTPGGSGNVRTPFGNFDFNSGQFSGFGGAGGNGTIGQLPQIRLPRFGRGAIAIIILAVVIVALLILGPNLVNFWTDLLWFQEVQQTGVFWVRFWQPMIIFLIGFVISFAVIMVNVTVARRFGPRGPVINTQDNPMAALLGGGVRFLNWVFVIVAVIISLFLAGLHQASGRPFFSISTPHPGLIKNRFSITLSVFTSLTYPSSAFYRAGRSVCL